MPEFIANEPALMIGGALVIADLHIGIEYELLSRGFNIPDQSWAMLGRIRKIFRENKCREIIINGDLRNRVWQTARPAQDGISGFVRGLEKLGKVTVVRGNHDGRIEEYVKNVIPATGFEYKGYWIMHGHAKAPAAAKNKTIIAAHIHPKVEFKDSLGGRISERVWIKSDHAIVMPHFNHLLGGTNVAQEELFAPMRGYIDPKKAELYLMSGLHLGKISQFKGKK